MSGFKQVSKVIIALLFLTSSARSNPFFSDNSSRFAPDCFETTVVRSVGSLFNAENSSEVIELQRQLSHAQCKIFSISNGIQSIFGIYLYADGDIRAYTGELIVYDPYHHLDRGKYSCYHEGNYVFGEVTGVTMKIFNVNPPESGIDEPDHVEYCAPD